MIRSWLGQRGYSSRSQGVSKQNYNVCTCYMGWYEVHVGNDSRHTPFSTHGICSPQSQLPRPSEQHAADEPQRYVTVQSKTGSRTVRTSPCCMPTVEQLANPLTIYLYSCTRTEQYSASLGFETAGYEHAALDAVMQKSTFETSLVRRMRLEGQTPIPIPSRYISVLRSTRSIR